MGQADSVLEALEEHGMVGELMGIAVNDHNEPSAADRRLQGRYFLMQCHDQAYFRGYKFYGKQNSRYLLSKNPHNTIERDVMEAFRWGILRVWQFFK
jgi:hypothetical protein